MFVDFYLLWPALIAALLGFVLAVRRDFWRNPAFVIVFVAFSCYFFYKVRIASDHFWMARRFVPIILPGAFMFIAAAVTWALRGSMRGWRRLRPLVGLIFVVLLGYRYVQAAAPVLPHVEYAGIIPYVERLARTFGDRDLVIVESGNAGSDVHILGLPLAYIYGRNVLVLSSPKPDKAMLRAFLEDATTKYDHVYFVGGGGTDLLSRTILAEPVSGERKQVPEYESLPDAYPTGIHQKEFDYSIYRLSLGTRSGAPFVLDVGDRDDLNVVRFHAKEKSDGLSIRWTQRQSYVEIPGLTGTEREVVLVMHDGGRDPRATPARVQVFFEDTLLGEIDVKAGFQSYRLALPADLAARAAAKDDPAQLKLISTIWCPHDFGQLDMRQLGVMLHRVEVH
jgi:hypothetical protein